MPMPTPELQREYGREWYNARRRAFFADKTCEECGATEELRLHHRVPAEKSSHRIWSWSVERRNQEIAKCAVLCHDCHVRAHFKTSCGRGHPFDEENTSWRSDGSRECRTCRRASKRAYRLRNRSTVLVRAEEAGDSIVHSATHSSEVAA